MKSPSALFTHLLNLWFACTLHMQTTSSTDRKYPSNLILAVAFLALDRKSKWSFWPQWFWHITKKFLHDWMERCNRQSEMSTAFPHLMVLIDCLMELIGPFGSMIIIELDSLWPQSSNKPLICCSAYFSRCDAHAEFQIQLCCVPLQTTGLPLSADQTAFL